MIVVLAVVAVEDVDEGCRERPVDLGVMTWRTGESDGVG